MKSAEVIFSPALLPAYDITGKNAVIIDILRATTSMCVAFNTGVKKILPVSTTQEAKLCKDFDFIIAAERNAIKVDGFDLGNSPFEFENPFLNGKSIAFTTTNGTKAIKLSKQFGAKQIAIGSFLNLNAVVAWLNQHKEDIVLVCSGWKDKINTEDTLFAGAILNQLGKDFDITSDACQIALSIYNKYQNNLLNFVKQCNHAQRFKEQNSLRDDVSYCLQVNTLNLLPLLKGEYIML